MEIDEIIAKRIFEDEAGEVILEVFAPYPDHDPRHDADPSSPPWRCRYRLSNLERKLIDRSTMGLDSMQALLLALTAAKADLCETSSSITWLGEASDGLIIEDYD